MSRIRVVGFQRRRMIAGLAALAASLAANAAFAGFESMRCTINVAPVAGPPGTQVSVRGICDGILYHRTVFLRFDGREVAAFDGEGQDYETGFLVPDDAEPGPHGIELVAPFARVSRRFGVRGESIFCGGDCDRNGAVEVNEVVLGVTMALAGLPEAECPFLDTDGSGTITVDELVAAVRNVLTGCGQCHDSLECPNAEQCVEPGGFIGCGVCQDLQDECGSDADCREQGDRYICEPARPQDCVCEPSVRLCQPGCNGAEDCGPNEVCDASFRCVPRPCPVDDCGPLFSCLSDATGVPVCIRTPCAGDSVCPTGACVNHRCYATLGTCSLPPP